MNNNMQGSGLYDHTTKKAGIKVKSINAFRSAFRIGDVVRIPCPKDDYAFRPKYVPICTVEEIGKHFIIVSHGGVWREAVNYVDFMVEHAKAKVVIASQKQADEYYALLRQYWALSDLAYSGSALHEEHLKNIAERLEQLEPLVDRRERFYAIF